MPIQDAIDPEKKYQINNQKTPVLSATFVTGVVALGQQIVAAVAGKRIRLMGYKAQGGGAGVGSFGLRSNAAGTLLHGFFSVPGNGAGLDDKLPIVDSGYFETNTGEGLFIDVFVAAVNMTVYYIIYTPN